MEKVSVCGNYTVNCSTVADLMRIPQVARGVLMRQIASVEDEERKSLKKPEQGSMIEGSRIDIADLSHSAAYKTETLQMLVTDLLKDYFDNTPEKSILQVQIDWNDICRKLNLIYSIAGDVIEENNKIQALVC